MLTNEQQVLYNINRIVLQGFNNLKPHWRGLGKSHIFFIAKGKIWRLESFYATEKVRSTQ